MSDEKPQVTPPVAAAVRDEAGKFRPGRSANPGGMSVEHRQLLEAFRDKCRRYSDEAYRLLVAMATSPIVENKDRLRALEMLLDRAWGRPAQPVVGEEGAPPVGGSLTSADMRQSLAQALAQAIAAAKEPKASPDDGDADR